jgi:hypothetical protein
VCRGKRENEVRSRLAQNSERNVSFGTLEVGRALELM